MEGSQEIVYKLTATEVYSILNWFYHHPFPLSDRSKQLAKSLEQCIDGEL